MQFISVKLQNFMSYESAQFRIDSKGLCLIEGRNLDDGDSNGSGKSTLFDGISYAIFGQTVRGLKADDVINRKLKKNCAVIVKLKAFGKEYTITRARKHDELGDRMFYIEHEKVHEYGTLALTQQKLLEALQIDFDLFRCTVLFAQGETFNFVNATNKEQKEILSKVMRINYDKYLLEAKNKHAAAMELVEESEEKITVLKSHIVEDVEAQYKDKIEAWEESKKEKVKDFSKQWESLREKLAEVEGSIKEIKEDIVEKIDDALSKVKQKEREASADLAKADAEIDAAKRDKNLFTTIGPECPKCKQAVSDSWTENLVIQCDLRATAAKEKIRKAKEFLALLDEKRTEYQKKKDAVNAVISKNSYAKREAERIEDSIEHVMKSLKRAKEEVNPYEAQMTEAKEKQKQIRTKIKNYEHDLEKANGEVPYYQFWTNAFGDAGIKSFVFDLICSNLTAKTNKYLNTLTGGSVVVTFDTQKKTKSGETREKFDCSIITDGKTVSYDAYSGGEKRRISLAVDMALSDLMSDFYGSIFNMVVFDEQTSYMDKSGRTQFMNLLQDMAKTKSVYVVDHDAEFKSHFDDVIVIEKKDGISRIAE